MSNGNRRQESLSVPFFQTGGPGATTQNLGAPSTGPAAPPVPDPAGSNEGLPPTAEKTASEADGRLEKRTVLLAGGIAAVVVLLTGGLALALTPGSEHKPLIPASKPDAGIVAEQAIAVNNLLQSGKAARGHLPRPLRTCDDVSASVPRFQQVVRDRQQELSQARRLKVDRLRDGFRLRRSMIAAYQRSIDADQAYLAWAQEVRARGCGGKFAPLTAHYRDAIAANNKAAPAKRQVVSLWRPIANSQSLPDYQWLQL